ncbi:2234_t:CDS:2 [Paraglomus occultum]|uniref:2234_t:CDS:1 n=1 Tax=Paraglomus occultum TaxID=144539 RepID=A0A9N9BRA5_9GLOM|nr:2234_t:CDS:2 [Paraglomus occultum]
MNAFRSKYQYCNLHALFVQCLVQSLDKQEEDKYQCPECKAALSYEEVGRWKQRMDKASFMLNVDKIGRQHLASMENNEEIVQKGNIYVVLLNGEKIVVDYEKVHTVMALRQEIYTQKKIEVAKQKLMYNGVELKNYTDDNRHKSLIEYGISANSHIQLIIIFSKNAEKETINELIFDLDYGLLDDDQTFDCPELTCFLYTGNKLWRTYDMQSTFYPHTPNTIHLGDVVDRANRRGKQQITSRLGELPENVTHLYFIISARNSPSIGCYKNLTFSLIDRKYPDKSLCIYNLTKVVHSKAVILCGVARAGNTWRVYIIGAESAGNAKDYKPIEQKIRAIEELV